MNKKIEKLDRSFVDPYWGVSLDEVVEKVNEIIDLVNEDHKLQVAESPENSGADEVLPSGGKKTDSAPELEG